MAALPPQPMPSTSQGQYPYGYDSHPRQGAHMRPPLPSTDSKPPLIPLGPNTSSLHPNYTAMESSKTIPPGSVRPPRLCKKHKGETIKTWDVHVERLGPDGKLHEVAVTATDAVQTLLANGLLPQMLAAYKSKTREQITNLEGVEILQYKNGDIFLKYKGRSVEITKKLTLKKKDIKDITTILGNKYNIKNVKQAYLTMIETVKENRSVSATSYNYNASEINFDYNLSKEQQTASKGLKATGKEEDAITEAQSTQGLEQENPNALTRQEADLDNIPVIQDLDGTLGRPEHTDCKGRWEEYLLHGWLLNGKKKEVTLAEDEDLEKNKDANRVAARNYFETLRKLAIPTEEKKPIFPKKPDIQNLISSAFEKGKASLFYKRLLNLLRKQRAEDIKKGEEFNLYIYISAIHSILNGGGDGNFDMLEISDENITPELNALLETIGMEINGLENEAQSILKKPEEEPAVEQEPADPSGDASVEAAE